MELIVYLLQRLGLWIYAMIGTLLGLSLIIPAALDTARSMREQRSPVGGQVWETPSPLGQLSEAAAWLGWVQGEEWLLQAAEWAAAPHRVPFFTAAAVLLFASAILAFMISRQAREPVGGSWEALTVAWVSLV